MFDEILISKLIRRSLYIIVIILIISAIGLLILKYNVEGEKNMPFKLSSIIVVSNAGGKNINTEENFLWNEEIYQNNDIYLNIEKNKNYNKEEIIKSIVLSNIRIEKKPKVGEIEIFRASKEENNLFEFNEEYKIENDIEYIGDIKSDLKNLKISNQGGTLVISDVNKTGKTYKSNEEELEHSGKLLGKAGIGLDEIKHSLSFDLIINLESGMSFKTNIKLDFPVRRYYFRRLI